MRWAPRSTRARGLVGILIAAGLFGLTWLGVTFAYGGFDESYELVGAFPRAGQGLTGGSDVTYRGVDVGEVRSIDLVDRQARVTMAMDPDFQVPEGARFVVRPKTIFGEKYVEITFPDGDGGPYLGDGDEVAHADAATEVEDFFEGADDLFDVVDEQELGQLISSMAETARGSGEDVARAWESGADAAALGADTIDRQLRALDSWAAFQDAIRDIGGDLNAISDNGQVAMSEFNANRDAYERALTALRPFAEDLADLLEATRPDIDTYLRRGDNVVRLLVANEDRLTELIEGLGQYTAAFAGGLSDERLPNGEGFAYFKNFIYLTDVEHFICSELAQAPPGLGALRDALLSVTGRFDCRGYYDPAPEGAPAPAAPAAPALPPSPDEAPPAAQSRAAQRLVDQLYGLLGDPQTALDQDLRSLIDSILPVEDQS